MGPGFESLTAYVEQYSDKKVNFVAIFVFYATLHWGRAEITLFAVKIAILQGKEVSCSFFFNIALTLLLQTKCLDITINLFALMLFS